jgi:hypothetical protein
MHDWTQFVRQRLAGLSLDAAVKAEVHAELAAHLEESYQAFRAQGLSERRAVQRTLRQVTDWPDLQHRITIAKNGGPPLQKRLHHLWIPGLLTFGLSTIFLIILRQFQFQPRLGFWNGLSVPWLLFLPCLGALGAYLSARADGSQRTVLLASLFPVLGLAFTFLLLFPFGLLLERAFAWQADFHVVASTVLSETLGFLLIPGTALLVGGLPVQLLLSRRAAPRENALS